MSELVDSNRIEEKVGALRHYYLHRGRAVSSEQAFYILHSQVCIDSGVDLRECPFSHALDRGIDLTVWDGWKDSAVNLCVAENGYLYPIIFLGVVGDSPGRTD